MKKITILASLLLASTCYAKSPQLTMANSPNVLADYSDVLLTVMNGDDIRIALSFKDCTEGTGAKRTNAAMFQLGLYTPNEVMITNDDGIAASLKHFTTNSPHAPDKPVYQYVTYKLMPDDNMHVSVEVFDAVKHTSISGKANFVCKMGVGAFVVAKR